MAFIELELIKPYMRHQMCFDGGSWGIQFYISAGRQSYSRYFVSGLKNRLQRVASQFGLRIWAVEDEDPSLIQGSVTDICIKVLFFKNDISGNRLLREQVQDQFNINLEELIAETACYQDRVTNFIPVEIRLDSAKRRLLEDLMVVGPMPKVFEALEEVRSRIEDFICREMTDLKLRFDQYVIGSLELNLDIVYPAGIDLADDDEVVLRLGRAICCPRRGRFVSDGTRTVVVPRSVSAEGLDLIRVFNSEVVSGVSSLYGHLANGTELYVACKQKPILHSKSDSYLPLKFWLHRFE